MDLRKRSKKIIISQEVRRSKRLKGARKITSRKESDNEDSNAAISNDIKQDDYDSDKSPANATTVSTELSSEISDSDSEAESMKTKYMNEREKIDMKRRRILEELNIATLTQHIQQSVTKTKEKEKNISRQFQKPPTKSVTLATRKSLRVLKKEPTPVEGALHEEPTNSTSAEEYDISNEQFPLSAVGYEKLDLERAKGEKHEKLKKAIEDYGAFIDSLKTTPVVNKGSASPASYNVTKEDLQTMTLIPRNVQKVTKKRIFSMAIHPSSSNLLVAASDTIGNLGLWKPLLKDSNNGTYMFRASGSAINTMKFSSANSNKLYMSSYSGQLRCIDLERAVMEEAVVHDADRLSSFDFVGHGQSIVAAHRCGDVVMYDTRESRESAVKTYIGPGSSTRCVSCHPNQHQYFLISYADGFVRFFDLRKVTGKDGTRLKEIFSVGGHGKSVNAAYFSPITGNSVLTTCLDDMLRVFDTKVVTKDQVKLRASCRHRNQTGRWLTPFKATWHPESDDVFVIGSLSKPTRQIELFNSYAKKIATLTNPDLLTTITSVNCLLKSSYVFGGNGSGRIHMFTNIS